MIESATFWKDGPEIETGELVTEEIGTEIFFLPAATHVEKAGSFTQTQRMLQWRDKAVDPPGDARSELDFYYELGQRIREKLAGSTDEMDRPLLDLAWDYPVDERGEVDGQAVLREINGTGPDGAALSAYTELKPDGSTACGCWIYCGVYADEVNQARRRKPHWEQDEVAAEWGWVWPANRRILYNRASAAPDGTPVERAQEVRLVGRRAGQVGRPRRARTSSPDRPPDHVPARGREGSRRDRRPRPVRHADRRQGLALRARSVWPTGRCPRTTSRRSRRCTTRSTPSRTTRRDAGSTTRATRSTRASRRSSPTSSPRTGSPSTTPRAP